MFVIALENRTAIATCFPQPALYSHTQVRKCEFCLTVFQLKSSVFFKVNRRFEEACQHLQDMKTRSSRNESEAGSKIFTLVARK
jgi:hypothetical protein